MSGSEPMAPRRKRKAWPIVATVLVVVLGTGEGIYWARRLAAERRQAEEDARAAKIMVVAGDSKDYSRAHDQVKAGHFDVDTIKRAVTAEVRRQTMIRVNGYFEQKTPQQRLAALDRVIDEAIAYNKMMSPSTRPGSKASQPPQGKGAFIVWMAQQPAEQRARLAEFGAAYNARLTQRGLPRNFGPIQ